MVTLHLAREDVDRLTAGADGSYLLDLTEAGQRKVVTAGERISAAGAPGGRAEWLRTLPVDELVQLARSRLGGPEPDVTAEAMRRVRESRDRVQGTLNALRGLGVLSPAVEEECHDGGMPR